MTDEERQRQLDALLEQQAALAVKLDLMLEGRQQDEAARQREEAAREREHARAIARTDRLERVVKLMVRAGLRARRDLREQEMRIQTLVDSQLHTEGIVKQNSAAIGELAEATRQNSDAIGELAGIVREMAGRQNGHGNHDKE